ncbi:MAG: nitroreductase family protein, partial [Chitinophagaceae bacterium]
MNRQSFIAKSSLLAAGLMFPFHKLFASSKSETQSIWLELLDYARWCPSPHNVQPWKLKINSASQATLLYDPKRIPVIVDADTSFTMVGMSMFIECLDIAARSKGLRVIASHSSEPKLNCKRKDFGVFAELSLEPSNQERFLDRELIKQRRTSRLHYEGKLIPDNQCLDLVAKAKSYGQHWYFSSDAALIHSVIVLNSETILGRADDAETMAEMRQWIRTSDKEAAEKKDGLWSRANATSGKLMHNFFYHHERFTKGWKRWMTKNMLNKGMKGTQQIVWIKGAFQERKDWVNAGIMLQNLWLEMTTLGIYLHPLGTIVTTPEAKEKFLKAINENEKDGDL